MLGECQMPDTVQYLNVSAALWSAIAATFAAITTVLLWRAGDQKESSFRQSKTSDEAPHSTSISTHSLWQMTTVRRQSCPPYVNLSSLRVRGSQFKAKSASGGTMSPDRHH